MPKSNGKRKNRRAGGSLRSRGDPSAGRRRQTVQNVLARAVGLHNQGALDHAEGLYHQILQAEPDHAVALNLLGVIAHARGNVDRAETLIAKSVALRPDNPDALNNLANILGVLGRHDEAEASYRKALAITDSGSRPPRIRPTRFAASHSPNRPGATRSTSIPANGPAFCI